MIEVEDKKRGFFEALYDRFSELLKLFNFFLSVYVQKA